MSTAVYLTKGLGYKKLPEEEVMKTLIYGVKSSGNQAERERPMGNCKVIS